MELRRERGEEGNEREGEERKEGGMEGREGYKCVRKILKDRLLFKIIVRLQSTFQKDQLWNSGSVYFWN